LSDLIAERYQIASTIVTSNLDFSEWDQAFPYQSTAGPGHVGSA
jgi:DNA replication protein DnaC